MEVGRNITTKCLNPSIRALVEYWLKIHHGTHLPGRSDFEPLDIPHLLKHVVLTDVIDGDKSYRVRLMGTEVVRAFEQDFTGKFFEDVIPNFKSTLGYRHRQEVQSTGIPSYRLAKSTMSFKLDLWPIERIHLPLASNGNDVDMILSMTIYMMND